MSSQPPPIETEEQETADFLATQAPELLPSRRSGAGEAVGDLAPHGTTIVAVHRDGVTALAGDGQVTLGDTIVKRGAVKVRTLADGQALIGMMPGQILEPPAIGLKVVGVFPQNHGTQYDSHQGIVMLFDPEHGMPTAILDASEVTAIRTAAASGVATRLLAREDAHDLAILETESDPELLAEIEAIVAPVKNRTWHEGLPENAPPGL